MKTRPFRPVLFTKFSAPKMTVQGLTVLGGGLGLSDVYVWLSQLAFCRTRTITRVRGGPRGRGVLSPMGVTEMGKVFEGWLPTVADSMRWDRYQLGTNRCDCIEIGIVVMTSSSSTWHHCFAVNHRQDRSSSGLTHVCVAKHPRHLLLTFSASSYLRVTRIGRKFLRWTSGKALCINAVPGYRVSSRRHNPAV